VQSTVCTTESTVLISSHCSSLVLQVGAAGDAEAQPGSLVLVQDHHVDAVQVLWRKDK